MSLCASPPFFWRFFFSLPPSSASLRFPAAAPASFNISFCCALRSGTAADMNLDIAATSTSRVRLLCCSSYSATALRTFLEYCRSLSFSLLMAFSSGSMPLAFRNKWNREVDV